LVKEHTERFLAVVSGLDGAAVRAQVPGVDWTVGQKVSHVHSVYLRYTTDLRRADTPHAVAVQNAEDIERLGIDIDAASTAIRQQLASLESIVPHIAPDQTFPFHAGQLTTMAGGWGNLLGELLAHGDDIARATGTAFRIPSDDTEILWRYTAPVLQGWLRRECSAVRETWRLRFPFGVINAALAGGSLRWDDDEATEPDHDVEIDDAAEFALTFPYRRRPIGDAAIALLASRFHDL
jgi:uncharacterized protein (TIGR03083 family)